MKNQCSCLMRLVGKSRFDSTYEFIRIKIQPNTPPCILICLIADLDGYYNQ